MSAGVLGKWMWVAHSIWMGLRLRMGLGIIIGLGAGAIRVFIFSGRPDLHYPHIFRSVATHHIYGLNSARAYTKLNYRGEDEKQTMSKGNFRREQGFQTYSILR